VIYDAFISFAGQEAPRMEAVTASLEREGFHVWVDRKTVPLGEGRTVRYVPPGSDHELTIRDAIDHAAVLVILHSQDWRDSPACDLEQGHARNRGMRVITVGIGEEKTLAESIRKGLEINRAHARLRFAAHSPADADRQPTSADSPTEADVDRVREGGGDYNFVLTPEVRKQMQLVRRRSRRRRRVITIASILTLAVTALLAAVAVVARQEARRDSERAAATARHVESLAFSTASESSENTFDGLSLARRAIAGEENATSVAALRSALERLNGGVILRGPAEEPASTVAVANDGTVAVVEASGALVLVRAMGARSPFVLPSAAAHASGRPVFSPSGLRLALVRDEERVEVVDVTDGRLATVPDLAGVVDLSFADEHRGVAVSRDGEVFTFDPWKPRAGAVEVGRVEGGVRAAAVVAHNSGDSFSLASVHDSGLVEVTEVPDGGEPWRVTLGNDPGPYAFGRNVIRACGDRLSLITDDAPEESTSLFFAVPYTVTPAGKAFATGSMFFSLGLFCLPEGGAVSSDSLYGQGAFPRGTPTLPGFTRDPVTRVSYAVASSENGRWAVAAGSDGTIRLVDLERFGRSRSVARVDAILPADPVPLLLARGKFRGVSAVGPGRGFPAPGGSPALGAYLDPTLGTVVGVNRHLLAIQAGRVRKRIRVGRGIAMIHPGRPGASAVVIPTSRRQILIASLRKGDTAPRAVPLPTEFPHGGAVVSDAVMLPGSVIAASDTAGYVVLTDARGGDIAARRLAPLGVNSLAVTGDGHLLLGGGDGSVKMLDPVTLAVEASRQVSREGVSGLSTDPAGRLVATVVASGEVVVLESSHLYAVAHTIPLPGLNSIAFSKEGKELVMGTDVAVLDGTHRAEFVTWPLCEACLGSADDLRRAVEELTAPRTNGGSSSFLPVPGAGR
jgi:WD40 repeat protein